MTGSLLKEKKKAGSALELEGNLGHTRPIDGAGLAVGACLVSTFKGCRKATASVSGADQWVWG